MPDPTAPTAPTANFEALSPTQGDKASKFVRVDMHMHSMWSGDCTTTPDELGEAVQRSGIDVLCVTDHNTIAGALRLSRAVGGWVSAPRRSFASASRISSPPPAARVAARYL